MSSGDGEDKRMIPVRSIFLRPDQYRKHWDGITPTKRSAHIRDRLTHADNFDFLRESVQWFATVMEVVLRENDHKGGWENDQFQYFVDRMKEEMGEIELAMAGTCQSDLMDVVNECADLANFAMMLAENAHKKAMEWDDEEAEEHGRE
jgi:hypothetical protein